MESHFLRAQVWGLFLQTLAFGIYLVTCASCYRVFFMTASRQRKLSEINWPILVIFLTFLAKATFSLAVHLYLILQMVTADSREQAALQFRDGSRAINISRYIIFLAQTVIASGFFIYRCWLIHYRTWHLVALPLVLWLGTVGLLGIVIHVDIHVDDTLKIQGLLAMSEPRVFTSCFWAVLIVVNILTTGLIAYRMRRVDQLKSRADSVTSSEMSPTVKNSCGPFATGGTPHNRIKRVKHIAIESGLIYTSMTLITFFFFVADSVAVYPAIDVLVQIIGISFNLVVIQNRPRLENSSLSDMNSAPLQFVSSNMSIPASAIEFAYPKHFTPRRKNVPTNAGESEPVVEDISSLSVGGAGIPQNHSQQSIQ